MNKHYENKVRWREIPDFPLYEMNSLGEVREKESGRLLTPAGPNRGYHYHMLRDNRVVARSVNGLRARIFPELDDDFNFTKEKIKTA